MLNEQAAIATIRSMQPLNAPPEWQVVRVADAHAFTHVLAAEGQPRPGHRLCCGLCEGSPATPWQVTLSLCPPVAWQAQPGAVLGGTVVALTRHTVVLAVQHGGVPTTHAWDTVSVLPAGRARALSALLRTRHAARLRQSLLRLSSRLAHRWGLSGVDLRALAQHGVLWLLSSETPVLAGVARHSPAALRLTLATLPPTHWDGGLRDVTLLTLADGEPFAVWQRGAWQPCGVALPADLWQRLVAGEAVPDAEIDAWRTLAALGG